MTQINGIGLYDFSPQNLNVYDFNGSYSYDCNFNQHTSNLMQNQGLWQLWLVHAKKEDISLILQGSLIEMTGPKRGIALNCDVLFEFDMRIKNGEQEENDLQLIDGITEFYETSMPGKPFTIRINGDAGAVDMSLTNVYGVEATVEIFISEVENGFDLSICCVVSVLEEHKEFQLFGLLVNRVA